MKQVKVNKSEACLAKCNSSCALEELQNKDPGLHSSTPITKSSQNPLDAVSNTISEGRNTAVHKS